MGLVFGNDETTHLCYDVGRGNGEPLILFGILLKFVVCCCGICYFDVFLSSRLGVYAPVRWWLWRYTFTCAVPLYFYINKSFYLYLQPKKKKKKKGGICQMLTWIKILCVALKFWLYLFLASYVLKFSF